MIEEFISNAHIFNTSSYYKNLSELFTAREVTGPEDY